MELPSTGGGVIRGASFRAAVPPSMYTHGASSGDQVGHRPSCAGKPADQPRPVHHGCRPAQPAWQRGPRLLRGQNLRREDLDGSHAMPQAQALRHRLSPDDPGHRAQSAGPGGHVGASLVSSAAGSHPATGTSDKSLPGPATSNATPSPEYPRNLLLDIEGSQNAGGWPVIGRGHYLGPLTSPSRRQPAHVGTQDGTKGPALPAHASAY
jgi:hypothetical protein